MPYSELIKNFNGIRDYMRDFYVCGFRSREEYTGKSPRSYDDERRRVESWLGEYMRFRQTPEGKNVFISIDSRVIRHDPLYRAWKASSFTDGDITLHFILFDILSSPREAYTLKELTDRIDAYLVRFRQPKVFDTSTVRKKLKEYAGQGLIRTEKQGKNVLYRRAEDTPLPGYELLDFFSETAPCGVIGSCLLDKKESAGERDGCFAFKHHYITGTMDSGVLCALLIAMGEKRSVTLETVDRTREHVKERRVIPLRIRISVQNGRQYLMAYSSAERRIASFRLDYIVSVKAEEVCPERDILRRTLDGMEKHMWGVSTRGFSGRRPERVEFTVAYREEETFIPQRLEKEKRCGTVERLDACSSRFSAEVYDAEELIPWMRTFIGRITSFRFSDARLEARFRNDLEEMYRAYGPEEEKDDLQ